MPKLGVYQFSLLQRILNTKIHGRRSNLTSGESGDTNVERDIIDEAVRISISDIDFRGMIRETPLTPNLMNNQYDYSFPVDIKGQAIIDLRPQNTDSRGEFETYDLVTQEEFDRRKKRESGIYTIGNNDLTRVLRISPDIQDTSLVLDEMEDTNWKSFDSTSVNDSDVKVDNDDYIHGIGAIRFQTDTTDSTDSVIGVQKTNIPALDLSGYLARGSVFANAKLQTYDTGIHQISLRLGTDSANYYQVNDSSQNDCSSFVQGWNTVRFDLTNKIRTGTPTDTAIKYAALFWSRDTTSVALLHLNDTDWGFDNLMLRKGKNYRLSYYSRYAWQDTGTGSQLLENSLNDSSALMVQNDELEVIMTKAAEIASLYLRDYNDAKYYSAEYQKMKTEYEMNNPSQASTLTVSRYIFGSLEDKIMRQDS